MKKDVVIAALMLTLSGCGGAASKGGAKSDLGSALLIPPSAHPTASSGQCDAKSLAYLVGKPRVLLPAPVEPSTRRVACSTCPMADDFRADRTTVLFDARTGLILSISCG